MRSLSEVGICWRDYLYANNGGKNNNPESFMREVEIIESRRNRLLEEILGKEAEEKTLNLCLNDISTQKAKLSMTFKEFKSYFMRVAVDEALYFNLEEILLDICVQGTQSWFYRIADEWRVWGNRANLIRKRLKKAGYEDKGPAENLLCTQFLNAVYDGLVEDSFPGEEEE